MDKMEQSVDVWIRQNNHSQPTIAKLLSRHLASKPVCQWLGDWNINPKERAKEIADHAKSNDALFQIVLYNIPNRDLGGFSANGVQSRSSYLSWVREVATGILSGEGFIIVEPDALAHAVELDADKKRDRLDLLRETVTILRNCCKNARIYIDAGHPGWLTANVATELLLQAGIQIADGISLNVANSHTTESCFLYGVQITEAISERHGMIIDTSRNGAGRAPPQITGIDTWANVPTNKLGQAPTLRRNELNVFSHRLHGLLWVKIPGESDGPYNGAPSSGVFWPTGALRLIGEQGS